ncbi:MAG: aminopeptidase P N-terminal domain-containing protein [Desulfococcaceae bacterium]
MRYVPLEAKVFARHRARFRERMKPRSMAVFNANDVMPTSADGTHPFVQQTDLFYLSGIDQEETILVLFPDSPEEKYREVLFVRETNENIAIWEGRRHTQETARGLSGIETVRWTSDFDSVFAMLAVEAETLYLNANEHLRADRTVENRDDRFIRWCRRRFPLHNYARSAPLLNDLRAVKDAEEIAVIRRAAEITRKAFDRVLGFIRPGVREYEIEAELWHEFVRNGSRGPAYAPIVASGEDTCVLHYIKNDKVCRDGDLVLMDFGAEYGGYASDLTRTVPVNGRFTPRQRAVYEAVLRVQRRAIDMLRPGARLPDYQKSVGGFVEEELIELGLLKAEEVRDQDPEKPLYRKFFMHGTSHHMGLDVHDYGSRHRPLEAGMVLTCEPGIYIREEGIGVRIETDVLVTDCDPVDLMEAAPVTVEEIEERMGDNRG